MALGLLLWQTWERGVRTRLTQTALVAGRCHTGAILFMWFGDAPTQDE
jgi:hypothetical protein